MLAAMLGRQILLHLACFGSFVRGLLGFNGFQEKARGSSAFVEASGLPPSSTQGALHIHRTWNM